MAAAKFLATLRRRFRGSGPRAVAPAPRANPGKYRMVAGNIEPTLLRGDMSRDERHRYIDVE